MNEYDLIAPFYDIEHAHFGEDLDMYANFAELSGGKILELACGSGRALLPLARSGYELTGVDNSKQMLQLAREALEAAGVATHCTLVQQDMVELNWGKSFGWHLLPSAPSHILQHVKHNNVRSMRSAHI